MIIELERAYSPADLDARTCGICDLPYQGGSVVAWVLTDDRMHVGYACAACIEYLGQRNPDKFPTKEDYEYASRVFPEPIWSDDDGPARCWELDGGTTHDKIVTESERALERHLSSRARGAS